MARVYMVRSLVPSAMKSHSRASASAVRAAPGTSIITPSGGTGLAIRTLRRRSRATRSEEHTSALQSLMRISYAVFCLKKQKNKHHNYNTEQHPNKKEHKPT